MASGEAGAIHAPLTERALAHWCAKLLGEADGLTPAERKLISAPGLQVAPAALSAMRRAIESGGDPLGEAFVAIRSPEARRDAGAVYTPESIIRSMMAWVAQHGTPSRVVDPGAGSGRFILAAGEAFPDAELIAIENDPLAALMLRANLAVRGWSSRATVLVNDFREVSLPAISGATAFLGNPPYVRHHDIGSKWKKWYADQFAALGIKASALAGLHLHFFLQTRLIARPGDLGAFITSAEWLDVNYGSALRKLLVQQLGGVALHVLEPTVEAFPGTATTAAIACFRIGELSAPVQVRSVQSLADLNGLTQGAPIPRARLQDAPRWSVIVRPTTTGAAEGIELGELFRVHRGQVTGANRVWIAGEHAANLPERFLMPTITKARELISAGGSLRSFDGLRRVADLPVDLDGLSADERKRVAAFLKWARQQGADASYVAQNRKCWWAVGLREPAPILCTYMARRPPQFTLNRCGARHINVAHGLYPREPMTADRLAAVVDWLNMNVNTASGRTYAGGLTKFECWALRAAGRHQRISLTPSAGRSAEGFGRESGGF